jgi:hypothetical protein
MSVGSPSSAPSYLFEVEFVCGLEYGKRRLLAPSSTAAADAVRDYASLFGLPHESVCVMRVTLLEVREEGLDAAA